jgi:hypothetical protein
MFLFILKSNTHIGFLIKAETSFKYSWYLLTLLLIKEAFTYSSFAYRATLSINLFVCSILQWNKVLS